MAVGLSGCKVESRWQDATLPALLYWDQLLRAGLHDPAGWGTGKAAVARQGLGILFAVPLTTKYLLLRTMYIRPALTLVQWAAS